MQGLKVQTDNQNRIAKIDTIVKDIYTKAIQLASTSSEKVFNLSIPPAPIQHPIAGTIYGTSGPSDPFYLNNMDDILSALQLLFPGCSVSHALMARGKDGNLYDLSKLDDTSLPLVDQTLEQSFIVIDWS
jgi:hypothetical protein